MKMVQVKILLHFSEVMVNMNDLYFVNEVTKGL